jgi:predicted transcriptional regulator of viral defense system
MAQQHTTVERRIARIAGASHGVVTRLQLLDAGISVDEITNRIRTGLLIREYRGVYRVGHRAPSVEARYLAAVRAGGDGAVVSGLAAGHLQGLVKGAPPSPEVTTPTKRRIKGVKTRRCRDLARDATTVRGIPVTTVPRTLVDLAADLTLDELARACHEAGVRYRTTPKQVEAVLARRPNSPGAGKLRRITRGDAHVTLSKLERAFLSLLRDAGLPLPETNRPAGGHRVDCRWPEYRLTVELDSYRFHNSRYTWERDRRREREARARGDEFRRYTWADVVEVRRQTVHELWALLPSTSRGVAEDSAAEMAVATSGKSRAQ